MTSVPDNLEEPTIEFDKDSTEYGGLDSMPPPKDNDLQNDTRLPGARLENRPTP